MQNIDWSSLGFRYMKTNSHIRYTWRNGAWDKGELVKDETIPMPTRIWRKILRHHRFGDVSTTS